MNYTYINSQIKVIEANILTQGDYSKLVKVKKTDFLKALSDLGYGRGGNSLEEVINEELSEIKKYLDEAAPDQRYLELFYLLNDVVNIKYLYKFKKYNLRDSKNFLVRGVFSEEVLREVILEDDFTNLPKTYLKLFKNINNSINDVEDAHTLSAIIDSKVYDFIMSKLRFSLNEPLLKYFKMKIDFTNLLTFVRLKNLQLSYADGNDLFIPSGNIKLDVFKSLFNLDISEVPRSLRSFYEEKLEVILNNYYKDNDLNKLELRLENLLLSEVKEFEHDSFGFGIIMYYYLRKQAEARNLKYLYVIQDPSMDDLIVY